MKKASTYYLAILTVINGLAAYMTPHLTGVMVRVFREELEGKRLPSFTNLVVVLPWWPHFFCFLCLAGCVVSISTKVRSTTLCHALIVGTVAELIWVFFVMLSYTLPFVSIIGKIGQ